MVLPFISTRLEGEMAPAMVALALAEKESLPQVIEAGHLWDKSRLKTCDSRHWDPWEKLRHWHCQHAWRSRLGPPLSHYVGFHLFPERLLFSKGRRHLRPKLLRMSIAHRCSDIAVSLHGIDADERANESKHHFLVCVTCEHVYQTVRTGIYSWRVLIVVATVQRAR